MERSPNIYKVGAFGECSRSHQFDMGILHRIRASDQIYLTFLILRSSENDLEDNVASFVHILKIKLNYLSVVSDVGSLFTT